MSIKKILMLASMALAAIAFAAPASALAAEDGNLYDVTTTGEPTVKQGEEIELTGKAEFTSGGTGIRCTLHIPLVADSSSTLTATQLIVTFDKEKTEACEYFGLYEGCELTSVETNVSEEEPLDVTVTTEDFDIGEVFINGTLGGAGCLFTFSNLAFEEGVTATPLNSETEKAKATEPIYEVALHTEPEGENCNDFGCLNVQAHGHLEISHPGTYALHH